MTKDERTLLNKLIRYLTCQQVTISHDIAYYSSQVADLLENGMCQDDCFAVAVRNLSTAFERKDEVAYLLAGIRKYD